MRIGYGCKPRCSEEALLEATLWKNRYSLTTVLPSIGMSGMI